MLWPQESCVLRYSEALDVLPDKQDIHKLYSNRSLAWCKAARYEAALRDAEAAVEAAPSWPKAHWRRGAALLGLQTVSDAVWAFRRAHQLSPGGKKTLPT